MPMSRKKSCVPCRIAKARCNLSAPCSRYSERDIPCNYTDAIRPRNGSTNIITEAELVPLDDTVGMGGGEPSFSRESHDLDLELTADNHQDSAEGPAALRIEDIDWSAPDWNHTSYFQPVTSTSNPQTLREVTEQPMEITAISHASSSYLQPQFPHISRAGGDDSTTNMSEGELSIYGTAFRDFLSPKQCTSALSLLAAQIIRGQFSAYSEMMIQGQLPPFIYPNCVLDGILPENCVVNVAHQCLPEPLAICTSLVRMFYGRTRSSIDFVWSCITKEVMRIGDEYQNYDNTNLLASLQAASIYVLLQTQDSQQRQEASLVIRTLLDLTLKLARMGQIRDIYGDQTFSQRDWAFQESACRTSCILYVFNNLITTTVGHRNPPKCGGPSLIPLPGPRSLWDYNSSEAWAHRFNRLRAEGPSEKLLTIRDLKTSVAWQTNADK